MTKILSINGGAAKPGAELPMKALMSRDPKEIITPGFLKEIYAQAVTEINHKTAIDYLERVHGWDRLLATSAPKSMLVKAARDLYCEGRVSQRMMQILMLLSAQHPELRPLEKAEAVKEALDKVKNPQHFKNPDSDPAFTSGEAAKIIHDKFCLYRRGEKPIEPREGEKA